MPSKLIFTLSQPWLTLKDWVSPAPILPRGELVAAINLGGDAVTIAGCCFQGYGQALAAGLSTPGAESASTYLFPQPHAHRGLRAMLNTVIFKPQALDIAYPLPNGTYQIYLWIMENYQPHWHALELNLNGQSVAQNVGLLEFRQWQQYGPYDTTVTESLLQLTLSSGTPKVDAHLMGLSIFKSAPLA